MQKLGFSFVTMANIAGRGYFFSKTTQILASGGGISSNPVLISDFYNKLEQLIDMLKIDQYGEVKSHVWNIDKTGL